MNVPRHRDRSRFQVYTRRDLDRIPQLQRLSAAERLAMKAVSLVLPFRVNRYVVDELIDWQSVPNDPIFQLTFPQPGMLPTADRAAMEGLLRRRAPRTEVQAAARQIQQRLNPNPAGQKDLNVPRDRFGARRFFFEDAMDAMREDGHAQLWRSRAGQPPLVGEANEPSARWSERARLRRPLSPYPPDRFRRSLPAWFAPWVLSL